MGKTPTSFGRLNTKGPIGRAGKRSRTGASAPVPTPCSPRARRFRRARPLSCTPYRTGAADTATPAALPAANAMQTDGTAEPMQPQPPEVVPASPPPPQPPILPRLPMPNARVRTLGSDCAGWQAAGAAGAAATVVDPPSATAQLPASQVSPLYAAPTRAQRHRRSWFSTQPLSAVL